MLTELEPFLRTLSRSAFADEAAIADNCRFDERAHEDRWRAFIQYLPAAKLDDLTYSDWCEAAKKQNEKRVCVPSVSIPDAMLEINSPAWLEGLAPNQELVRLETLEWPLSDIWNISFQKLTELHAGGKPDDTAALSYCLDSWNRLRDNRPAFAAFYDEVKDDADDSDWPHKLRDRLGLGHYAPGPKGEIPVALMRYSLKDVLDTQKKKRLPCACALPSALDGGMNEFFFPVPKQQPYGAALHLGMNKGAELSAEIIHCRIDYQLKHMWKLGFIRAPHQYQSHDAASQRESHTRLRSARDLHLMRLRIDSDRHDFGEEMENRS